MEITGRGRKAAFSGQQSAFSFQQSAEVENKKTVLSEPGGLASDGTVRVQFSISPILQFSIFFSIQLSAEVENKKTVLSERAVLPQMEQSENPIFHFTNSSIFHFLRRGDPPSADDFLSQDD